LVKVRHCVLVPLVVIFTWNQHSIFPCFPCKCIEFWLKYGCLGRPRLLRLRFSCAGPRRLVDFLLISSWIHRRWWSLSTTKRMIFFWMRSHRPRRSGSDEMWSGYCCHWQPQNLLILSIENLKHPAWMTKSSRRDPHGRRQLTRVNSTNVLDDGLWIGGKATTRNSRSESDTRRTQVHIPAVEDRYVLLAI
jgi:hypothetical protein